MEEYALAKKKDDSKQEENKKEESLFNIDDAIKELRYPGFFKLAFKQYLIDNGYIEKIKSDKDFNKYLDEYKNLEL